MDGTGSCSSRHTASASGTDRLGSAVARLQVRVRRAVRLFRELTGFSAVTTFGAVTNGERETYLIAPAAHPTCASVLGAGKLDVPC